MNAKGYIHKNVLVKLQPSRISGVGVFAIQNIPKGTKLFLPWEGKTGHYKLTEKEMLEFPKEVYKHIKDLFLYPADFPANTNTYVYLTYGCHWIYTTPQYFINSDIPNSNFDNDTATTTKDISVGQELVGNYKCYERAKKLPI